MKVTLINSPNLYYTDNAIGMCYDKGSYCTKIETTTKAHDRIQRVANINKHSSVLEFTEAIFDITASTKVLLEMTRHRKVSYACKSSRYTLNKGTIIFETTGDNDIDCILSGLKESIEAQLEKGKPNDIVSLMLPQAYQYRWTAKFNYRSLQNFFSLRLSKHAHPHIREVAEAMLSALPKEHLYLFQ